MKPRRTAGVDVVAHRHDGSSVRLVIESWSVDHESGLITLIGDNGRDISGITALHDAGFVGHLSGINGGRWTASIFGRHTQQIDGVLSIDKIRNFAEALENEQNIDAVNRSLPIRGPFSGGTPPPVEPVDPAVEAQVAETIRRMLG